MPRPLSSCAAIKPLTNLGKEWRGSGVGRGTWMRSACLWPLAHSGTGGSGAPPLSGWLPSPKRCLDFRSQLLPINTHHGLPACLTLLFSGWGGGVQDPAHLGTHPFAPVTTVRLVGPPHPQSSKKRKLIEKLHSALFSICKIQFITWSLPLSLYMV